MSTFLSALLLGGTLLQIPLDDGTRAARSYHEINQELRALLRAESRASSESDRAAAIRQMAQLYLELKRDPRLGNAPTLQRYQAMLWSRLTRVKQDLEQAQKRSEKEIRRRRPDAPGQSRQSLDQQAQRASAALAIQLSLVSHSLGGPAHVVAQAGTGDFAGGAVADNASELIELIHHVIAPETWDVNGGTGTIIYYAPLHALVIRASSRVHDGIGGALRGLRRAGP